MERRKETPVVHARRLEQMLQLRAVEVGRGQQWRRNLDAVGGKDLEQLQRRPQPRNRPCGGGPNLFGDLRRLQGKLGKCGVDQRGAIGPGAGKKVSQLPPPHGAVVRITGRLGQDGRQAIVEPHFCTHLASSSKPCPIYRPGAIAEAATP